MCIFLFYFTWSNSKSALVINFHSEKMRRITFPIWLVWLIISAINAELTLESVYQKVNDLEVEVTALKVNVTLKVDMTRIVHIFRVKTPS